MRTKEKINGASHRWPPDITKQFRHAIELVRRKITENQKVESDIWAPWNHLSPQQQLMLVTRTEAIWISGKPINGGITAWDEGAARAIWLYAIATGRAEAKGNGNTGIWTTDMAALLRKYLRKTLDAYLTPHRRPAHSFWGNNSTVEIDIFVDLLFADSDYDYLNVKAISGIAGVVAVGPSKHIADKLGIPGDYFRCPIPSSVRDKPPSSSA